MQIAIIGIGLLILGFYIFKALSGKPKQGESLSKPAPQPINTEHEIINDKLIIVSNANYDDVKKAMLRFCKMYNEDNLTVVCRLFKISGTTFVITFPYDIGFEQLCYFVNYLKYPIDIKYDADVLGWATTKKTDQWITEKSANKQVMLYISDQDEEYDNVLLTTEDNIGYKLGFAVGEETQLLKSPLKQYNYPVINIRELKGKPSEDFQ